MPADTPPSVPSIDLLVVGAGINGGGIARDAARRAHPAAHRTHRCAARRRPVASATAGGETLQARAIANVAGPRVKQVLNQRIGAPSADSLRLVRGGHLAPPRLYAGEHAFIPQNADRRVVFMISCEGRFTLLGTTDVLETGDLLRPQATAEEAAYLCAAAGRYLQQAPRPQDAVWRYAGVRPLYDEGSGDPAAVTRDYYTLRLDSHPPSRRAGLRNGPDGRGCRCLDRAFRAKCIHHKLRSTMTGSISCNSAAACAP